MPGYPTRWTALAAILLLGATATSLFIWHSHNRPHPILRAGIRNNSLSSTLSPEGRVDALAVAVVSEAARRIGLRLQWLDCPEGPDQALKTKKVDLWPL